MRSKNGSSKNSGGNESRIVAISCRRNSVIHMVAISNNISYIIRVQV